jgi:hypothetical protein
VFHATPPSTSAFSFVILGTVPVAAASAAGRCSPKLVTFRTKSDGCAVELHHVGIPDDGVSAQDHGRALADEFEYLARLVES